MLEIASRANRGIRLPSPKQSRARIITMFKQQLYSLKERLDVRFSPVVLCYLSANILHHHSLGPQRW